MPPPGINKALKPKEDITRSAKQGYQCSPLQNIFLKIFTKTDVQADYKFFSTGKPQIGLQCIIIIILASNWEDEQRNSPKPPGSLSKQMIPLLWFRFRFSTGSLTSQIKSQHLGILALIETFLNVNNRLVKS